MAVVRYALIVALLVHVSHAHICLLYPDQVLFGVPQAAMLLRRFGD
jgi:hypothetical protein